jgi:hypothetical protein
MVYALRLRNLFTLLGSGTEHDASSARALPNQPLQRTIRSLAPRGRPLAVERQGRWTYSRCQPRLKSTMS